jgi:hypothetical protein
MGTRFCRNPFGWAAVNVKRGLKCSVYKDGITAWLAYDSVAGERHGKYVK